MDYSMIHQSQPSLATNLVDGLKPTKTGHSKRCCTRIPRFAPSSSAHLWVMYGAIRMVASETPRSTWGSTSDRGIIQGKAYLTRYSRLSTLFTEHYTPIGCGGPETCRNGVNVSEKSSTQQGRLPRSGPAL